jgi:hypothetical protein
MMYERVSLFSDLMSQREDIRTNWSPEDIEQVRNDFLPGLQRSITAPLMYSPENERKRAEQLLTLAPRLPIDSEHLHVFAAANLTFNVLTDRLIHDALVMRMTFFQPGNYALSERLQKVRTVEMPRLAFLCDALYVTEQVVSGLILATNSSPEQLQEAVRASSEHAKEQGDGEVPLDLETARYFRFLQDRTDGLKLLGTDPTGEKLLREGMNRVQGKPAKLQHPITNLQFHEPEFITMACGVVEDVYRLSYEITRDIAA